MIYLVLFIVALAAAEITVRKLYVNKHGVPYRCKHIGEYPYNEFIEECPPPLHWKLKPGYGRGQMHINSLGFRAPELKENIRRIWLVGESEFFGAKLPREDGIWFRRLQQLLDENAHQYQVINASVIGYNQQQMQQVVCSLPLAPGDILLLRPNMNDVSIAYMQGKDWQPGNSWPLQFIHKLQSHKQWYLKLLDRSCLGMLLRRRILKKGERKNTFVRAEGFQWERLLDYQKKHLQTMLDYAEDRGARVAFFSHVLSYKPKIFPQEEAGLSAIQSNWREFVEGWSEYQFGIVDEGYKRTAAPRGLPMLNLAGHIWRRPDYPLLYLDLVHFNAQGHAVLAGALYDELLAGGLLTGPPENS
jgi:hypothetical protein